MDGVDVVGGAGLGVEVTGGEGGALGIQAESHRLIARIIAPASTLSILLFVTRLLLQTLVLSSSPPHDNTTKCLITTALAILIGGFGAKLLALVL